ncbi:hypothetical protein SAY87_032202 [Trapa incisa]|uniref:adenylate dimethylallyltransferase (ADP/ATP-dependent) n=1 Tax=Trapa incisa TaxID=236973 RepID=A0AAN7KXD0_9MYRT|nr:hypothetical protein SAY87_032202 [Trapa incisa]
MGSTGTGKSRLAVALAKQYNGEIVNSDVMQLYKGLAVTTNKMTDEEREGVPHHLMDFVEPDFDFTEFDFCHHASLAIEKIHSEGKLPIVAGGSNYFIDTLVNNYNNGEFKRKYRCCFLWVDVDTSVLDFFVSDRVDKMVRAGLVEEARGMYDPHTHDYSIGMRQSIGVRELDLYFRAEEAANDECDRRALAKLLADGIEEIKENTRLLTREQLKKIHRLYGMWGSQIMHRIDSSEVFMHLQHGKLMESYQAWVRLVMEPSSKIVRQFLDQEVVQFRPPRPTWSRKLCS